MVATSGAQRGAVLLMSATRGLAPAKRIGSQTTQAKTLTTLEFDKVLQRLAGLTSFSAGRELALALQPTNEPATARRRQALTAEARDLRRNRPNLGFGGAHDVRPLAAKAALSGMLDPQ